MGVSSSESTFPILDDDEIAFLRTIAKPEQFQSGQIILKAGDPDIDFGGRLRDHRHTQSHGRQPRDRFARRPAICGRYRSAYAPADHGHGHRPGNHVRTAHPWAQASLSCSNTVPRLSEKLLTAFMQRRELLQNTNAVGLLRYRAGLVQGYLMRSANFFTRISVPFIWYDSDAPAGKQRVAALGNPKKVARC